MSDWKPLAQAVDERGGLLGGGLQTLHADAVDGIIQGRAALAVHYTEPPASLSAGPTFIDVGGVKVQSLGTPSIREASHRTDETDYVLSEWDWTFIVQNYPGPMSGSDRLPPLVIHHQDGIGWSRLRDIRIGGIGPEATFTPIERRVVDWVLSERAAGRDTKLHAGLVRFAPELESNSVNGESRRRILDRLVKKAFPDFK